MKVKHEYKNNSYNVYLKNSNGFLFFIESTDFKNDLLINESKIKNDDISIEVYQLNEPYSDNFSIKIEKNININLIGQKKLNMVSLNLEANQQGVYCVILLDSNGVLDNNKGYNNGSCITTSSVVNQNGKYDFSILVNDGVYTILKIRVYKNTTNGSYIDIDNYQINCPNGQSTLQQTTVNQTTINQTTINQNQCPILNKVSIRWRYVGEGGSGGNQWAMNRLIGSKIIGSNDGISWSQIFLFSYTYVQNNFTPAQSGVLTDVLFTNSISYKYIGFETNGQSGIYQYYDDLDLINFYSGNTLLTGTQNGTFGNWQNAFDSGNDTKWGLQDSNVQKVYINLNCTPQITTVNQNTTLQQTTLQQTTVNQNTTLQQTTINQNITTQNVSNCNFSITDIEYVNNSSQIQLNPIIVNPQSNYTVTFRNTVTNNVDFTVNIYTGGIITLPITMENKNYEISFTSPKLPSLSVTPCTVIYNMYFSGIIFQHHSPDYNNQYDRLFIPEITKKSSLNGKIQLKDIGDNYSNFQNLYFIDNIGVDFDNDRVLNVLLKPNEPYQIAKLFVHPDVNFNVNDNIQFNPGHQATNTQRIFEKEFYITDNQINI